MASYRGETLSKVLECSFDFSDFDGHDLSS
jgi:hypothetical protein